MARRSRRPARFASLWALLLVCFDVAGLVPSLSSVAAETPEMVKVSAVSGGDVTLPCDTRSPQPNDVLLLVVWYKNDIPVYSYDSRIKGPTSHWADDVLAGRARWHATAPSSLRLRDVLGTDRALYRCRVDFKISPTRNQKVMLDVIELPEKPKVIDELETEIIGIAGPYVEDTSLKLTCVVSGGKPGPRLRWWRDEKVIASQPPVEGASRRNILELRIPKLTREYFEAVYTCTADNTILVPPLRANVQLLLYLRPLIVEILPREQPLSVGQEAQITCRAVGARPPAVITWWLDETQMTDSSVQKDTEDRNETLSILQWTPRMEHNGRVLTCRAAHVKLEYTTIETRITLDLHYVPIVVLQLGSKLNPNDIEEGDDVYFECIVRSNPPAYKVVWEHNGQAMTHNQRAGVIAGSAHLALQSVSKEQAGKYSCTASNVEGDGKSRPVNLQVIYKPICTMSNTIMVGAAFNEPTKVKCEVDAFPPPKNFQWILNNSMGSVEIDSSKFKIDVAGYSVLTYKPVTEADYGSLVCRATNLAGQQIEPCRYILMPAVKPEQPYNCSSVNLTENSAELRCIAGYDGGLQTMYVVEAWESGKVVLNETSPQPIWKLRDLGSGKALKLLFYAFNAKGKSDTTKLRVHTLTRMALHTEATTGDNENASRAFLIIAGISATIILIVIVAFIARRRHHHSMRYEAPIQTLKAFKGTLRSEDHSPQPPDDKNPDVVPLGKDFKCTRDLECPPDPPPYGAAVSPPVVLSRSGHSLHKQDLRTSNPQTPNTPNFDSQSIGTLVDDRRSVSSGTFSRRREVVTTRTPLLANARESCV